MGALDIQQLLGFDVDSELSEDQLDELYSGVDDISHDAVSKLDSSQLGQLFFLAQYAMRSKQVQLTVAVEEIEKLAEAAGENEELKQRNVDLQKMVNKFKGKGTDSRDVDLRTELEELQTVRNQLKKDLKTKQRQLDDEKHENDKLMTRVEELESERRELRRQMDQLNETLDEFKRGYESRSDPEETGERQYTELIKQKNQYINVLLDDVETHEKEKAVLQSQVTTLQSQLTSATSQIETMAAEFEAFKREARPAKDESGRDLSGGGGESSLTVQRLEAQVAELQAVKARRDAQFDQLAEIVEQRTEEFKRLITDRDAEIETLRAELRNASANVKVPSSEADSERRLAAELRQQCDRQRRQLAELQADLRSATADMEAVTAQLEMHTGAPPQRPAAGGDAPPSTLLAVRAELTRAEAHIRQLTQQLDNTERQAAAYNDQVTELTVQLRAVMDGEYGLSEAVEEIKEWKRKLAVRDRQVAEQNSYINLVQRHLAELVDENSSLRSKLGMEPHEAAELVANSDGKEKLVHVLEREVEKLEEERIALKLENRKLSRQVRSGGQSGLTPDEIRDICRQRKEFWEYVKRQGQAPESWRQAPSAELFERLAAEEAELAAARERAAAADSAASRALAENDKLRQGMREILQSIKEQDAVSAVQLAAPSLEALLQAMETRSLVGEYHPALVPYSMLQQLEGKNEELRTQLRAARAESRVGAPVVAVPAIVPGSGAGPGRGGYEVMSALSTAGLSLPAHLTVSSSQLIGHLTAQLTVTLKALDENSRESEQTRAELETLRQRFAACRHQMGLAYQQRAEDADRWQAERRRLEADREEALAQSQELEAKLSALETGALALHGSADEQRTAVAEAHRQMAVRVSEAVRAERRLRLVAAERQDLQKRLRNAETELQQARTAATDRIAALKAEKKTIQFQLGVLQKELGNSAPLSKVTEVNEKIDEVTSKYSTLLSNQEKLLGEERTSRLLEAELDLLRRQLPADTDADQQGADPAHTDQTTLAAQLAEMTSREKQQRLRADHATRMAQLLKDQLSEAESHASSLESRVTELAETGAAGRLALARLADQLTDTPSPLTTTAAGAAEGEQAELGSRLLAVEGERDRLRETLHLATGQLEYLRSQRNSAEHITDTLRQELAQLQDKDDLRAVIACLHQRLLCVERSECDVTSRLSAAQAELAAAQARLYQAETEAGSLRTQMAALRTAHAQKIRRVRLVVQELRGCLSLPQRALQERLAQTVADLLRRRQEVQKQLRAAQESRDAADGEREGVRSQRVLLDQALAELKEGTLEVRTWIDKCQEVELEVTSLRLKVERLTTERNHVRDQLMEEERRATEAESAVCRLKNQLELREMEQQLSGGGSAAPSPRPAARTGPPAAVPAGGSSGGRPSRLLVPVAAPTPARRESVTDGDAPPDRQHRDDGRDDQHGHDDQMKDACEKLAAAVRVLMTSLGERSDVTGLESRLSAALEPPISPVQLMLVSSDVIRLCDVRPGDVRAVTTTPSPVSAGSSPLIEPAVSGEVPDVSCSAEQRRLRVAQTAAASLEQRLRHKEQSLAEYRALLAQARRQAAEQAERHRRELAAAADQLRHQVSLVASLQAESSAREAPAAPAPLSDSQLSRLHESAELLAEQERAIGALMERLRQSREEEARYRDRVTRLESERRDTAEMLGRTVSALAEKQSRLKEQLAQERRQAAAAADARTQAHVTVVTSVTEIFSKREKQHHASARLLRDVKNEVVDAMQQSAAQDTQQVQQEQETKEDPADRDTGGHTASDTDRLHGQLRTAQRELDNVKNALNDRTLQCHRLQAELHESERRRREDTQKLQRQLDTARQKLKAAQESLTARSKPTSDPNKVQEELAKWDERKKWQRTAEKLRARLKERETECERQQALSAGLRDTIHRLEREKTGYEAKIRTLTGLMSEDRFLTLERENQTLKEELSRLRGSAEGADREYLLEQLRQQVHTLTTRLAQQRAAAKQTKGSSSNIARYESELAQLRAKTQELEEQNAQLKTEVADLRRECEAAAEQTSGGREGSGDAEGRQVAVAATDAGTVSILRRLVERLRADNLRLRRQLLRHTVTSTTEEQVELLKSELSAAVAERDNMAAQLKRLRAMELRQ